MFSVEEPYGGQGQKDFLRFWGRLGKAGESSSRMKLSLKNYKVRIRKQ